MSVNLALPARLAEIVEDFRYAEGREKLELLIQYADQLPPLPPWLEASSGEMESVPECMTPVWVAVERQDGGLVYHFKVPEESPTVRGYAALLAEGLHGVSPEDVLALPPEFYLAMGLQDVLTPQRLNGMAALVAHVKKLAVEQLK